MSEDRHQATRTQLRAIEQRGLRPLLAGIGGEADLSVEWQGSKHLGLNGRWEQFVGDVRAVVREIEPDETIKRQGEKYLRRWFVNDPEKSGRCYLHHLVSNDPDDPHGHPFESASLLIDGTVFEDWWSAADNPATDPGRTTMMGPGSVVLRSEAHRHRLRLSPGQDAITLFVTGAYAREWGFWTDEGEVHWRTYIAREAAHG